MKVHPVIQADILAQRELCSMISDTVLSSVACTRPACLPARREVPRARADMARHTDTGYARARARYRQRASVSSRFDQCKTLLKKYWELGFGISEFGWNGKEKVIWHNESENCERLSATAKEFRIDRWPKASPCPTWTSTGLYGSRPR